MTHSPNGKQTLAEDQPRVLYMQMQSPEEESHSSPVASTKGSSLGDSESTPCNNNSSSEVSESSLCSRDGEERQAYRRDSTFCGQHTHTGCIHNEHFLLRVPFDAAACTMQGFGFATFLINLYTESENTRTSSQTKMNHSPRGTTVATWKTAVG